MGTRRTAGTSDSSIVSYRCNTSRRVRGILLPKALCHYAYADRWYGSVIVQDGSQHIDPDRVFHAIDGDTLTELPSGTVRRESCKRKAHSASRGAASGAPTPQAPSLQ